MLLSKIIGYEFSPQRVLNHIDILSRIHRVVVTTGYEKACDYVESKLREFGLDVERVRFEARDGLEFLGYKSIQKWIIRSARLEIVYPSEKKLSEFGLDPILADFGVEPISIVQRSAPTPREGIECEIIPVENCYDPNSYDDRVRGNIVLIRGEADKARAIAAEMFGAVGIITDKTESASISDDPEMQNARVYQSFWWFGGEKKIFGFVITPRQGKALRRLLKETRVIVRAYVDSEFVDDYFSVVTGFIDGKSDEEIWVVSHIDHPMPGAEDNASGVSVSLEIARVLEKLISDGKIPRFERRIRFIYPAEFMGTAAYVAYRYEDIKAGKIIGAVNLDMVGSDEKYGASLLIIEPPYESGSYIAPLMRWLMNYLISTDEKFAGAEDVPMFRWGISKFSAGSDYYILSDPIVGISTIGINRWPYRYYHTSKDTPDKIGVDSVMRVGILVSVFLSILATVNHESADWLAEITKKYYGDLMENLTMEIWTRVLGDSKMTIFKTSGFPHRETFSRAIGLLNLIYNAAKKSLIAIRDIIGEWWDFEKDLEELENDAIETARKIKEIFGLYAGEEIEKPLILNDFYAKIVPERTGKLFDLEGQMAPMTYQKLRKWREVRSKIPKYKYYPILDITLFKADGKKTLDRIIREIYYEFGIWAPKGIAEFFRFLEDLSVVKLKSL